MKLKENIMNNKKALIATIMLLLLVITGVSFAFFSGKLFGTKESFKFGDGLNIEFILDAGSGLSYTFDPLKMTSHATENYLDSDKSVGKVSLTNNSEYDNVTCEYEVWFKSESSFNNEDISLIAQKNDQTPIETSLKDLSKESDYKITNIYITAGAKDTDEQTAIHDWNFNFRHYILENQIQNDNIGQEFKGHVYFKTVRCFEGKGHGETLLDACDDSNNLVDCIKNTSNTNLEIDYGEGKLIRHTSDDTTSAGDDGIRYSGDDSDNFICFGLGSEKYNRGETKVCPIENKYRIIGLVPVKLANGSLTSLIKLIKAEYLTTEEFVVTGRTAEFNEDYNDLLRIESDITLTEGYHWNDENNNVWEGSSLQTSLNSEDYLNKAFGITWRNMIANVTWNVGGISSSHLTAKDMYNEEMNVTGVQVTKTFPIGLMYVYDYGFASNKNNWTKDLGSYSDINNLENNWLYNANHEWLLSRDAESENEASYISDSGSLHSYGTVNQAHYSIRPVFYLTEDVNIVTDDKIAYGSKEHPLRIQMNDDTLLDMCDESGNLIECFKNIKGDLNVGKGELIHHTESLQTGTGDNGYRYSGDNPNNYICFGNGSEGYNNGENGAVCRPENKYRIIGYVPVTLADSQTQTNLVKVIKAEYLTRDELDIYAGTAQYDITYQGIKRIEGEQSNIDGFAWNSNKENVWDEGTLYSSLNSDSYLNNAFEGWKDKIASVKWNIQGYNSGSVTPKEMYNEEMTTDPLTQPSALIGLMYVHDYGFASREDLWGIKVNEANEKRNNNNWLYNGLQEWTITPYTDTDNSAFRIKTDGSINGYQVVNDTSYGVRPVFYLNPNVTIDIKDFRADGSQAHPFRVLS